MRTSYGLLRKYIDLQMDCQTLARKLTMNGLEVEAIENFGQKINNVVVGEIITREKHSNADNLTVCKVNVGSKEVNIVCGAKNHQAGDKVPVAMIGAILPNGLEIKKAKLRGVESEGMICSKTELGLEKSSEGVWILDQGAKVGESINTYLPKEDYIFHVAITANRSDCLSNIGIAREAGIAEGKNIRYPETQIAEDRSIEKPDVTINDPDLCLRYSGRIVRDVKVGESPEWLKEALTKYGARPINKIVDITNYVMFELGQPMHAFDLNKLSGKRIIARRAKTGEKIKTLDSKEYELNSNMLVIADTDKAVAIAGVMGGANSEVDENTTDILLESAFFSAVSVRKTAKKLGIKTESSYRFEREIDPDATVMALDFAASLVSELCGGKISPFNDVYPKNIPKAFVTVRKSFVDRVLGFSIDIKEIERIFQLLEFSYKREGETFNVTFPSFRRDCTREIDVVEEIVRAYGYENIPETMRPILTIEGNFSSRERSEDVVKKLMSGFGFNEAYNFAFMNHEQFKSVLNPDEMFTIRNPFSMEFDALRTSLFPSLINNLKTNNERSNFDVSLFEVGKVFKNVSGAFSESKNLGILLSGKVGIANWISKPETADFYYMKGIVEEFFKALKKSGKISYQADSYPYLHPGKTASILLNNEKIGYFGELHPDLVFQYDLKENAYFAEINLDQLDLAGEQRITCSRVSKYPAVERDLAFVVDRPLEAGKISEIILSQSKLVKSVKVADVYTGKPIPEGKKSVAFSFIIQSDEKTLTDEEIRGIMNGIIEQAKNKTGASLREA